MNNLQYTMIMKSLKNNHHTVIGEYTLDFNHRYENIYEFSQIWQGKKTVLYVGDLDECVKAAEDFIQITFGIN